MKRKKYPQLTFLNLSFFFSFFFYFMNVRLTLIICKTEKKGRVAADKNWSELMIVVI